MLERIAREQHDTLEDVPEPSENPNLFGHESATSAVVSAYWAGRLPRALLISGPRGIGKATFAFHIAHHLLSFPASRQAPDKLADYDTASSLFRQMATDAHPSILHLTRPFDEKTKKFRTVLTVEEVRRIGRFLSMTSHDGSYRIIIVDPADDMNANAANALLKNLEEPPARTLFMLIAHSEATLLPTIRSRCQLIRLGPLDPKSLLAALSGATGLAACRPGPNRRAGRGSVRNAIFLTEYGGIEIADTLAAFGNGPDSTGAHRLADAVAARGEDIRFDIFNASVLDVLSGAAAKAAISGQSTTARRLSRAWHDAKTAVSETDTYNLDRKQHALTMIDRLTAAMRM